MLDASKIQDMKEISKYGKASGFLVALRYKLPTFSHFYVVENEEEVKQLLNQFEGQNNFCMRSDTKMGNTPIGIGGKNGNRETIFEYMEQIRQKSESLGTKGVALIYWNDGEFCPTYRTEGSFYLDYQTNQELMIDYVGKGWDGSFLSHGSACHESYVIPWEEILFLDDNKRGKYRKSVVSKHAYADLRQARIEELKKSHENYGLTIEECETVIPCEYSGIQNEHFRQVIHQVILPMYDSRDLQRNYKEYIPIAQIENGKVVVPEVILPARLKYRETKKQAER